jgi:ferrous iron transport protein A
VNEPRPVCPITSACPDAFVCPLSRVVAGTAVRIRRLDGPPEVSLRLRELGFCEQQRIKLLSRHPNLICLVCNARLGISPELADKILVEPIGNDAAARSRISA